MTDKLQHAAADVIAMAIQWAAEDRTAKTAAALSLAAAVARYQRLRAKHDSDPPTTFAEEPVTEAKRAT